VLDLIRSWGWHVDLIEALDIRPLKVNSLPPGADAWIISSRNSWSMVQKFINQAPASLYCIGRWLAEELRKAGTASGIKSFENMRSLVAELSQRDFRHVLYFCGDNHRGELEDGVMGQSTVTKVITHESRMTVPVLGKTYDAIFVFSPRSAESILKNNTFAPQTVFACIGPTTVSYLHDRGISNTFCASYPEGELLIKEFHSGNLKSKY
jgi:uroporphyrinogen-III synthase